MKKYLLLLLPLVLLLADIWFFSQSPHHLHKAHGCQGLTSNIDHALVGKQG